MVGRGLFDLYFTFCVKIALFQADNSEEIDKVLDL